MNSPDSRPHDREDELDRDIERYREAANSSLEQLEWTVEYLNRIHRPKIAQAIDRNRKHIIDSMR